MRIGQLVMLIGTDGFMPPLGAVGEIVEAFDGEDYGVDFPGLPCPVPPESYWYVPPRMLMPINVDLDGILRSRPNFVIVDDLEDGAQ